MKGRLAAPATFVTLVALVAPLFHQAASAQDAASQVFSSKNDDWKAPELRIALDEFRRLQMAGEVLILDVRDLQSYRQGHLPGAILMTPEELSTDEGRTRLKGEKRTIVAYCS